jgi:RNA polymerase sigma-70 factor (TIGR02960 family)
VPASGATVLRPVRPLLLSISLVETPGGAQNGRQRPVLGTDGVYTFGTKKAVWQREEDAGVNEQVLARARAGDAEAFTELVEPYRPELRAHCYRILGSIQDAEDVLQETLLAAWRRLGQFEGRASVRAWLYRIATNRCLNALRDGGRRPEGRRVERTRTVALPEPTHRGEPLWLEPYPDVLLDGLADQAPGPEARYETKESISLAFVAALQLLPPRQRATVVLRDVLGLRAAEVADILECSQDAVAGALKRGRATLASRLPADDRDRAPLPDSPRERAVLVRFVDAFEAGDVAGIAALLTDDARLTMPPLPFEYHGRTAATQFLSTIAFRDGARQFRLVPTRANIQPAFGCYERDRHSPIAHAHGLIVLTMEGDQVSALTRFLDNSLLPHFGLPRTLRE